MPARASTSNRASRHRGRAKTRSTTTGKYYRVAGGFSDVKPVQPTASPVYFGGSSDAAIAGRRQARRHLRAVGRDPRPGARRRSPASAPPPPGTAVSIACRFSLSFRPILADTEDEAWATGGSASWSAPRRCAHGERGLTQRRPPPNEGSRRLLAAAAQGVAPRQAAVHGDRGAHRRAGQLDRAGRHARSGRRRAARLLRPRRHDLPASAASTRWRTPSTTGASSSRPSSACLPTGASGQAVAAE